MNKLLIISILTACIVIVLSCTTLKNRNTVNIHYNVLLSKASIGEYLQNEYKVYGLTEVKRNSRSKNQYAVSFSIAQSKINELEKAFAEDEIVESFSKIESKGIEVKTSTNVPKN